MNLSLGFIYMTVFSQPEKQQDVSRNKTLALQNKLNQ